VAVALVTGAGRGLGAEIASTLAARGFAVAVNDLNADTAATVATRVGGVAVPADVTDEDAVTGLVAAVESRLGPVAVLVANATGPQPVVPVEQVTWRTHLDQLEFFVKSPTLLTQAVLPGMKAAGAGRVVFIGSDMPDRALPGWSSYVAAKAAQVGLARVMARELGPFGITVNVVAPGWIPVERHAEATPAELAEYAAGVPLGRMGTPSDVAATVAFLASADAAFMTGQCIRVNGGQTVGQD
jgi:3-oxoacyl-[acyl-carrier protein] reductase